MAANVIVLRTVLYLYHNNSLLCYSDSQGKRHSGQQNPARSGHNFLRRIKRSVTRARLADTIPVRQANLVFPIVLRAYTAFVNSNRTEVNMCC